MRLHLILRPIEPMEITPPNTCPFDDCRGEQIRHYQTVGKPLRDTVRDEVQVERYLCLECGRTFRVYPRGVTHAQIPQRVKDLGVLLHLVGLSYGATSRALEALGIYLSKSSVYEAVHAVAKGKPDLKQNQVFAEVRTSDLDSGSIRVRYNGHWVILKLTFDDTGRLVLSIDRISSEDAEILQKQLEPTAESIGVDLLVTNDTVSFKTTTDEMRQADRVSESHIQT